MMAMAGSGPSQWPKQNAGHPMLMQQWREKRDKEKGESERRLKRKKGRHRKITQKCPFLGGKTGFFSSRSKAKKKNKKKQKTKK